LRIAGILNKGTMTFQIINDRKVVALCEPGTITPMQEGLAYGELGNPAVFEPRTLPDGSIRQPQGVEIEQERRRVENWTGFPWGKHPDLELIRPEDLRIPLVYDPATETYKPALIDDVAPLAGEEGPEEQAAEDGLEAAPWSQIQSVARELGVLRPNMTKQEAIAAIRANRELGGSTQGARGG